VWTHSGQASIWLLRPIFICLPHQPLKNSNHKNYQWGFSRTGTTRRPHTHSLEALLGNMAYQTISPVEVCSGLPYGVTCINDVWDMTNLVRVLWGSWGSINDFNFTANMEQMATEMPGKFESSYIFMKYLVFTLKHQWSLDRPIQGLLTSFRRREDLVIVRAYEFCFDFQIPRCYREPDMKHLSNSNKTFTDYEAVT